MVDNEAIITVGVSDNLIQGLKELIPSPSFFFTRRIAYTSLVECSLIDDETVYLATISPNTLSRPGIADLSDGGYILTIDNGGESGGDYDVTVSSSEGGITVTGTGRYVYKSDEFTYNGGDEPCPEIDLEYTFETGGKKYRAIETLVLRRDPLNDLRVEEWQ